MSYSTKTAVVILAAGSIQQKYQSYSFIYNSPALVPIASRSALSFILDFYAPHPFDIYIAINAEDESLFRKELGYYHQVRLVPIYQSAGVCDTLNQALQVADASDIIVNLTTTIPTALAQPDTVFADADISYHSFYSGFITDHNPVQFTYKKSGTTDQFHAFTGIFRSSKHNIAENLKGLETSTDLLEVVEKLYTSGELKIVTTSWIDTGHEINYADARKKLISSRSFNSISVDPYSGILTKKSKNIQKLRDEKNYVRLLPDELQIVYPRILPGADEPGVVWMEYYGYPNLSEYQLYRNIHPAQWIRIFESLEHLLKKMSRYRCSIAWEDFEAFYIGKTFSRVEQYLQSLPENDVLRTASEFIINGKPCANLPSLKNKISTAVAAMYREEDFCIMHGDFCFNNILYDTFSNTVKLIDPRGSFGESLKGIYGDRKYDVAKLMHSAEGHYDYIVNNLFSLEEKDNQFWYQFPLRENQETLNRLMTALIHQSGCHASELGLITGLLFLSMCPLHTDNPNRQRLMYIHGLQYVNTYIQ